MGKNKPATVFGVVERCLALVRCQTFIALTKEDLQPYGFGARAAAVGRVRNFGQRVLGLGAGGGVAALDKKNRGLRPPTGVLFNLSPLNLGQPRPGRGVAPVEGFKVRLLHRDCVPYSCNGAIACGGRKVEKHAGGFHLPGVDRVVIAIEVRTKVIGRAVPQSEHPLQLEGIPRRGSGAAQHRRLQDMH